MLFCAVVAIGSRTLGTLSARAPVAYQTAVSVKDVSEASHDIKSVPRHCLSAWKTSLSACRCSSQGVRVLHTMRRPANSLTVLQIVV